MTDPILSRIDAMKQMAEALIVEYGDGATGICLDDNPITCVARDVLALIPVVEAARRYVEASGSLPAVSYTQDQWEALANALDALKFREAP